MNSDAEMSQKRKARSPRRPSRADQTAFQKRSIMSGYEKKRYHQNKENNAQNNGDPEQCALNTAAGSEDTASIGTCQSAQACTFTLNDNTEDKQDGDYNQRDIDVGNHLQRASFY